MWRTRQHASHTDAPVFLPGTDGAQIIPAVAPLEGEPVVVKHAPNAFRDTSLKQLLDDQHVEQLVVIGAMSHMCVEATTRAAADFG
ncbi:isochorismatase family protein [Luteimonas sp. RIT-PG2_3]